MTQLLDRERLKQAFAMKLYALGTYDRGEKDMEDARQLARHLGISEEEELMRLFASIHDEEPPVGARARFPAVLGRRP